MNAAELMAALKTVEQDHQLVLDKVQALRETVSCLLEPGDTLPRRVLDRLRELNGYFSTQLICHMDEEEVSLFPLVERHASGGAALVVRLRREHEEIRLKLEEFGKCLHVSGELEDHLPRMVARDLLTYGWQLWDVLDNHAHLETEALRECIAQGLDR
jgi:iron-sulfur cluster repair protein YtfE (RIC family)